MDTEQHRKTFLERLADRVYILLGVIFISMGVMMAMAWWGSDFSDYLLGSMAVYLLGAGLALTRLQDFFEQRAGLMTRQSGLVDLRGFPAQIWTLYWIFSFLALSAVGVYLVFDRAASGEFNILAGAFALLGLAALRLVIYLWIDSRRMPQQGLSLSGWGQAIFTLALLVLFWLVVIAVARIYGRPY
jgi:hypothetical protein